MWWHSTHWWQPLWGDDGSSRVLDRSTGGFLMFFGYGTFSKKVGSIILFTVCLLYLFSKKGGIIRTWRIHLLYFANQKGHKVKIYKNLIKDLHWFLTKDYSWHSSPWGLSYWIYIIIVLLIKDYSKLTVNLMPFFRPSNAIQNQEVRPITKSWCVELPRMGCCWLFPVPFCATFHEPIPETTRLIGQQEASNEKQLRLTQRKPEWWHDLKIVVHKCLELAATPSYLTCCALFCLQKCSDVPSHHQLNPNLKMFQIVGAKKLQGGHLATCTGDLLATWAARHRQWYGEPWEHELRTSSDGFFDRCYGFVKENVLTKSHYKP